MGVPPSKHHSFQPDASATILVGRGSTSSDVGVSHGDRPDDAVLPGNRLGRYLVLELLGRGGMGTVVRAYDPRLHREVALKRLRADLLDDRGEARLMREAQAMAQLNHPNVVAVYDVETDDAGVVLVMECVQGRTLQEWIRSEARPWRDVVSALERAGRGLAAAHAAGLVHRDFKPANILVTDDGRVEVGDFGLARAASHPEPDEDASRPNGVESSSSHDDLSRPITRADTVLGTPAYMAPEQHAGAPATTASDQYSFCITSWEALCGERPFSDPSWKGLLRSKTAGPPPWPKPAGVPSRIADAIRRGLHPQPEARWPSMGALLDAIAVEQGTTRRRAVLFGATIVALGLVGALAWQSRRPRPCDGADRHLADIWDGERRAEIREAMLATALPYAADAWQQADAKLDAYGRDWIAQHVEACEATAIRHEQSAEALDLRMACLRAARSELAAITTVLSEADGGMVMSASRIVGALPGLDRCADVVALRADVAPPTDPELASAVEAAYDELAHARAEIRAGRHTAAEHEIERLRARAEALDWPPLRVRTLVAWGVVHERLGRYTEAEEALHEAMRESLAGGDVTTAIDAARSLASVLADRQGRPAEGLWVIEIAVALARAHHPDSAVEAETRTTLGVIFEELGRYPEAEHQHRLSIEILERTVGTDDVRIGRARNNLGIVLELQGRFEDAEAEERKTLELWERVLGREHPDVAMVRNNIAGTLLRQGRLDEAEAELRVVIELRQQQLGPQHPQVATARSNLAAVLTESGRLDEAKVEFDTSLRLLEAALGPDHPSIGPIHVGLAEVWRRRGDLAAAESHARRALAVEAAALEPTHPDVVRAREALAELLRLQGR